jgi:hypothetical protein
MQLGGEPDRGRISANPEEIFRRLESGHYFRMADNPLGIRRTRTIRCARPPSARWRMRVGRGRNRLLRPLPLSWALARTHVEGFSAELGNLEIKKFELRMSLAESPGQIAP